MAELSPEHKRFIVERLACFDEPTEVVEAFSEAYPGVDVTRQQVWNYDASKDNSRTRMAGELVTLFDETREKFRSETEGIPIAMKTYRLNRLNSIAVKANRMRNYKLQMEALEQAAKECGDAYTNKREITGKNGSPLQTVSSVVVVMPDNGRGDRDAE